MNPQRNITKPDEFDPVNNESSVVREEDCSEGQIPFKRKRRSLIAVNKESSSSSRYKKEDENQEDEDYDDVNPIG